MQITGGTVFDLDRGFVERDLYTDGAHFTASPAGGQTLDATGCYVIPGLVDVHFHGCVGEDFSDATPDGLQAMADYELSQGVTYICPAGMTLPEEQLRRLKFLDLNGKDLALDRERTERLTHDLGKKLGIPVVSGSDTHQAVQYGCVTTVFEREVDTVPALYGEMTAGRYAIDLSDTAAFQVRTACLLKRSLKEIHALGGDYVAILTREATA